MGKEDAVPPDTLCVLVTGGTGYNVSDQVQEVGNNLEHDRETHLQQHRA